MTRAEHPLIERASRVSPTPEVPPRALDASMDLLNQVLRQPVDPDYAVVAARGPVGRTRWAIPLVALLVGAMFAVSAALATRQAPALAGERGELIDRIQAAQTEQDILRARVAALNSDLAGLSRTASGGDQEVQRLQSEIDRLAPLVGATPVTGPGLVVVVDDAPTGEEVERDRVLDLDLQMLANGLWQAGAEAVAINGHRLSALTAIRGAGDAITVDYRSLTRPYRIEAIGDPRSLEARFTESTGGAWWNELARNRQMSYEISAADELTLSADPGIVLRYARSSS